MPTSMSLKPWACGSIADNAASYLMALHPLPSVVIVPKCQPALTPAPEKNAWLSSAQVLYVHDIFNDSRPLPAIPLPLTQKNQTP